MLARWVGFLVWVAAGASLVFWALRLLAPGMPVPPQIKVVSVAELMRADHRPMLGAPQPAAAPAASPDPEPVAAAEAPRLTLVGVVAPPSGASSREALALIAVDDNPPRAFRVGNRVGDELVLQSVSARVVRLAAKGGAPAVELEVPLLPVAVSAVSTVTPAAPPGARTVLPAGRPAPAVPGATGGPSAAPAPGGMPRTP